MKPDRSNYEIWLIDWLDGNLDEIRTEQLMIFLDENPDLKDEADSLLLTRLDPDKNISTIKSGLIKTPSDLPLSQVEYLSIAYLENDLSEEQIRELQENISLNPGTRKLFNTIQKTKLTPPEYSYGNKEGLYRKTTLQAIYRFSRIGLSAAAAITILLVIFLDFPRSLMTRQETLTSGGSYDTILIQAGKVITVKEEIDLTALIPAEKESPENIMPEVTEMIDQPTAFLSSSESALLPDRYNEFSITAVPVFTRSDINDKITYPSLVASNIVTREPTYYDQQRGRVRKFIAGTFRERILKEEVFNDAPLQPHEIAGAGIEGLNKLLGWQMALVTENDEEGELKSFQFSSGILKLNAPVKKTGPSL